MDNRESTSGLAPGGGSSLDCVRKRFSRFKRFKRFKGVGAAHKNIEAPRSINSGDARRWYVVTCHLSLVTTHAKKRPLKKSK